jgi:hypothetical protein
MSTVLLCAYIALHGAVVLVPRFFTRNFGVYVTGLIVLMLVSVVGR